MGPAEARLADRTEARLDWVMGDALGLPLPAHPEALAGAGPEYLTRAFHAGGALAPDNRVVEVTRVAPCPGGSTGRKLFLSVAYAYPQAGVPTELFAKFSRDFEDPMRDRGRDQLEAEVKLGRLSAHPNFPVVAPTYMFGDYHRETGTGVLVTARVFFGRDGIEPPHHKCRDYDLPDALGHYEALVGSLAALAGAHKAGRLPEVEALFPFDRAAALASDPIRYDARQIANRVARYHAFAAEFPQLLPESLRSEGFNAGLAEQLVRYREAEGAIKRRLHDDPDYIALCHWNGNVDNAWFWRGEDGGLRCGLLDWGRVGQMNLALALFGCLSAAEPQLWRDHLDQLLALFVARYAEAGGPRLDPEELKRRLLLTAAMMGLAWLLDAPPLIRSAVPDLAQAESRFDPRVSEHEMARTQLHMLSIFLTTLQMADLSEAV